MYYFNKRLLEEGIVSSDFQSRGVLSNENSSVDSMYGFANLSNTYNAGYNIDGPYNPNTFKGWTFASLTEDDLNAIRTATGSSWLSTRGTFPITKDFLASVPNKVNSSIKFQFNANSIKKSMYANNSATYNSTTTFNSTDTPNKFIVNISAATCDIKPRITHLVYIECTNNLLTDDSNGIISIYTKRFIALTVGEPGSGAEVIVTDTRVSPGKPFLFSPSDNPTIDITVDFDISTIS